MKAFTFAFTLLASFGGASAQDGSRLGDLARGIFNTTVSTVSTLDLPRPSELVNTVDCDENTLAQSSCQLLGGLQGVNVCRTIAGVEVGFCTPRVFENYVGAPSDTCGCCGGACYTARNTAYCTCQDGAGVLVDHTIFRLFGREFTWKGCYTENIASQMVNSRPEFTYNEECPAAVAALAAEAP